MNMIGINKILRGLNFIIPVCYILMGCILLTDLFASIKRENRTIFGIIIIIYGIFRIYKAHEKMKDMK